LIGEEELYRMRADAKLNGVSEQIAQPQSDCERYDDRNSNERKHPVRVRHSVFSNAPGLLSAVVTDTAPFQIAAAEAADQGLSTVSGARP
jgi:hypothetical protein